MNLVLSTVCAFAAGLVTGLVAAIVFAIQVIKAIAKEPE